MYLIKNIHLFTRLEKLSISLQLTTDIVKLLIKVIRRCLNLRELTIYVCQPKKSIPHYKVLQVLERINLNVNIKIRNFHRNIAAWENNNN